MALASGDRLGPFEIVAALGAGGMGEVYRARDTRLDRTVAIKVIASSPQDGPDRAGLDRFRQEARAIARINHPGICALHDVGQEGPTTFLVMEYVAGETLANRLAGGALPLALAVRTAAQIAEALDHAHRQGVTHRDLKPANIMLMRDGVKILDFGLAKLRDDPGLASATTLTAAKPLTEAGMIVGTLPYMSPEQVEGRSVDARSDIFSFGVVLYEMVTGRRPFAGDSRVSLMSAIVGSEPPAVSTVQPVAPPALDRLIGRALAKDPEERWQDARDLAAELRWIAEAGSGASRAAPAAGARRSRRTLLVAGLAGAAVVGAGVAAVMLRPQPSASVPVFRGVTFRRGVVTAARFAPDGQSIVYSGNWQAALPHDIFFGRADSADARPLQLPDGRILAVSGTGDLAVHFRPRQTVTPGSGMLERVLPLGGGRRELLEGVVDADWIPNTQDLAVARVRDGRTQIEFPSGTKVHEAQAAWSLRVSPDGTRVAFFEGPVVFDRRPDASVVVVDRSGQQVTIARGMTGVGLAWAPSGREVLFTATHGRHAPSLFGASLSGQIREIYRAPDWLVLHDAAPDGRLLMSRNSIRFPMSCQAGGETVERDLTWLFASQPNAITRDGQSVIFSETLATSDPAMEDIYRRRLDGSPAVLLGQGTAQGLSPSDKWLLISTNDGLALLPTGAGSVVKLPRGSVARILGGGWLDDGRVVFNGSEEGATRATRARVFLQSVPDGLPRPITPEDVTVAVRAPTPDGRSILVRSGDDWQLRSVEGESRPGTFVTRAGQPLQWSQDGKFLYVADRSGQQRASVNVYRVEIATGQRVLWKTLAPADPLGVDNIGTVTLTEDGAAYCYNHLRRLGDLFVVEGIR